MEYRYLGKTGLRVSELCLGAMGFGRESDEPTSHALLDRFSDAGGTFVDTADVYSAGRSEEILGRWLKQRSRDDVVVATKVRWGFGNGNGPNGGGLSRKRILAAVDGSLRRLGTDYIDLYQLHAWDPGTPLEEILGTLDGLVRSGKVRYVGASNFTAWQLQKAIDLSARMGWEQLVCLQPLYNLLDRSTEWELLPICRNEGLGLIVWGPLRGGWLSGRIRRGMTSPEEGSRIAIAAEQGWSETWSAYDNERTWEILDALFAVAEEAGKEPAQVALNWLLRQPGVTAPIIGARNLEQLESNLGAAGWSLSDDQVARLNEVSAQPLPYPYFAVGDPERERTYA